jgi:secreted trypsin-like serine protease
MKTNHFHWTQKLISTTAFTAFIDIFAIAPIYAQAPISIPTFGLDKAVFAGSLTGVPPDNTAFRITNTAEFSGIGTTSTGCTATAISSTAVISAAHCFNPNSPDVSFKLNGIDYAGKVSVFPGAVFPFDDVAVISLSQSLPSNTPIYELLRTAFPIGNKFEFVGYGDSGDGVNGASGFFDQTTKRTGSNSGDLFYSRSGNLDVTRSDLIAFDFDGTNDTTNSFGGTTLGNAIESVYGGGDSGSPNFMRMSDNSLRLVGVSTGVFGVGSFSTPLFGSGGIFTDLSRFTGFIDETIAVQPVPFEFTPAIGIGLIGIWAAISKLRKIK